MELRDENLIELTQQLIQRPSPSGKEQEVAEFIKSIMEKLGFQDVRMDEMGSVTGAIKGNRPGKRILLDGHMDTVSPLEYSKWTHHPYGGEIEDGKIFGRGASDMKGSLASMIFSAARFNRKTKGNFAGEVYISCTVYEEVFEGVACRKIVEEIDPDLVIIGEATSSSVKIGQRGRAEVFVKIYGKTGHSSNPEKGINAVLNMNRFINELEYIETPEQRILGKGILEITDIISHPYPGDSMIPDSCTITLDRRTLVGETEEDLLKPIREIIKLLEEKYTDFKGETGIVIGKGQCYTGKRFEAERFFPAWLLPEDDDIVQRALKGLEKAGIETRLSHFDFCTNGSYYCGIKKIPSIGYGPSKENLAHIIDEYIAIEDLLESCKGFQSILEELTL